MPWWVYGWAAYPREKYAEVARRRRLVDDDDDDDDTAFRALLMDIMIQPGAGRVTALSCLDGDKSVLVFGICLDKTPTMDKARVRKSQLPPIRVTKRIVRQLRTHEKARWFRYDDGFPDHCDGPGPKVLPRSCFKYSHEEFWFDDGDYGTDYSDAEERKQARKAKRKLERQRAREVAGEGGREVAGDEDGGAQSDSNETIKPNTESTISSPLLDAIDTPITSSSTATAALTQSVE